MIADCGLAWMWLRMYTPCLSAGGCCSQQQSPGGRISYKKRKTRDMAEFQEVSWAGTRQRSLLLPHTTTHIPTKDTETRLQSNRAFLKYPATHSYTHVHLWPPI